MKDLPKGINIRDKYSPAMEVKTEEEAAEYFEICVRHTMLFGGTREDAEAMELQNIGYYGGYHDAETRERVYRLFNTKHPIFGGVTPAPEEALKAGADMAAGIM